jgi:hypothetical protein
MKFNSFFKILLFGFICAFIATSCTKEGPMGPAGADGKDGVDGQDGRDGVDGHITCLVCHDGTNMETIQGQFWMSAHSVGAIAVDYAGGRASCAPCHSHEQFVQVMTTGSVAGDITNPSAWDCNTCHGIHKSFEGSDYALRSTDPVNPNFDKTLSMDLTGNSNLCAVCHQSRTAAPGYGLAELPDSFRISSTHYGPHHGAQANVVAGIGFAEIPGSVSYPAAGTANHLTMASCTGCHMASFANRQGGHSFIPSLASCNECHDANDENFNYGGVQTEVHEMLVELRDKLIELHVVEGNDEEGYHPHVGTYPIAYVQAFFNWVGLEEDRSLGVHNPKYVKALLRNSMEALEGATANH